MGRGLPVPQTGLTPARRAGTRRPVTGLVSANSAALSASSRAFSASSAARRSASSPSRPRSRRASARASAAASSSRDDRLAGRVVAVDLLEQLVDEAARSATFFSGSPLGVDHPHVLRAGDAEVGVARLADAVHRAAEDRDLDRVLVGLQAPLDLGDDASPCRTAGARRSGRRSAPGPRSRSLSALRISQATLTSSSAWNVESEMRIVSPIAVGQQRAEADRALQRARPLRARLGHAEVQRVRDALGEQPVGGDRVRHRRRLHRHLEVRRSPGAPSARPSPPRR